MTTIPFTPRRFTREEYMRLAEVGILGEDDRVELLGGQIIVMTPIGREHIACVERLTRAFWKRLFAKGLDDRFNVSIQNPVILDDWSEPQSDVVLSRGAAGTSPKPEPPDTLLAIEVADASYVYDRHTKAAFYARAGIPELWIVDVPREAVEVLRKPSPEGYRAVERKRRGKRLTVLAIPSLKLTVDEVLGERPRNAQRRRGRGRS